MNRIYLVLFLLVFFSSCKKKTTVTIQAQDYLSGSGEDYAGKAYVVSEIWWSKGLFPKANGKTLKSGTLDAKGHASFEVKMRKGRDHILELSHPASICYNSIEEGGVYQELADEKTNVFNFQFLKGGYVKILHNNINCEGSSDDLVYEYKYSSEPSIHSKKMWSYQGCNNFNNGLYTKTPVGNYTIEWQVSRPSGITTGIDYFTVTENDSTTHLIEY